MPPVFFKECPSNAWSGVSILDVFDSPINLPVSIKVAILRIAHLTNAIVTAIDCINTPIRFSIDQFVETDELFEINNP